MKIYVRKPAEGEILGPFSIEEISAQVACGELSIDFEACEATGQTYGQLKRKAEWVRISNFYTSPPTVSVTKFRCPNCAQRIESEANANGQSVQCPTCRWDFVVAPPHPKTSVLEGSSDVAFRERLRISWGVTALIAEILGWLLYGAFVDATLGEIKIVVSAIAITLLFAGGIMGLVATIRNDGRAPGLTASALLFFAFIVFR